MANNLSSNITQKLIRVFLEKMETARVLSKNVNTQLLSGAFGPDTGSEVNFKRPTDAISHRTPDGDISATARQDIIAGKAKGTVQDYITVHCEFKEVEQALELDQLDELLEPFAQRLVTDLELSFADFMAVNAGLISGTPGTPASTWEHIADAGAGLTAHGVPGDAPWYYGVNPYTQVALSTDQRSLGAGGVAGKAIMSAHEKATIVQGYAGFDRVMTSTALNSHTTDSPADRAGTLSANPTVTYVGAKDTMTQSLAVTAFGANLVVKAGETIQIAGRYRMNLSTRRLILDASGNRIPWSGTVTAEVTLGAAGEGTLVVTGPAIYEATGAYNTVDSAPISGDVVTLLGAASTIIQPNMYWHKNAFGIGSVKIDKLYSTDTIGTTKDGLQIRVSKYSDGDANKQIVRFDLHPAFAAFNPFLAGKGFG